MPIPVPLVTSLVGGLMSGPVTKILDAYIADTELRRKLEADLKGKLVEHLAREEALQQSVVLAEIASESWLTRSWRPLMMTGIFAFLAFVGLVLPLADLMAGRTLPFNPRWTLIPPELWQFLSIGVGGYVGGRSLEKIAAAVAPGPLRGGSGTGPGRGAGKVS
ncbi:3TM-type holin [Aestuariivirga sp.]|uniref:3TM-type holin n=1 Tax=Aestuariivirga sp. TaxID=2650926 RepID=UPI0039E5E394